MAAVAPVAPNPSVLVWARTESGYGPERVAKRLGVKLERVEEWEGGERIPTMRQLEGLARLYHRPFGIFFRPKPPVLPALATEYRRLPGLTPGHESPELRLAIRKMSNRRETMIELVEETGGTIPDFELAAHLHDSPTAVAAQLRSALDISLELQLGWANEWRAWSDWRTAVEDLGVLVFQVPGVALEEVRGISLFRWPLPVVGINSRESSPEARSYTLIHEVVHLMLANGKEEQAAAKETRESAAWQELERFVEETTSHVLVPETALAASVDTVRGPTDDWDVPTVRKLARRFRITPLAMATRLRASGYFNWTHYQEWKREWDAYVKTLRPKSGGFASPVDKTLGRAGRPFTKVVLEAMAGNRITSDQAARHLDLKFDHFDKLRDALRKGPGTGVGNE